ncbi:PA14 domain-containing protein, partial [Salirhabdus euzebyi]
GSPAQSIPTDNFSARFTKKVQLEAGTYVFSVNGDDGVRVKLDNEVIIDAWPNTGLLDNKNAVYVTGGEHIITIEYFESAYGASISFDQEKISSEKLYYKYTTQVQENWGYTGPGGFPSDNFKAEFDQSQRLKEGNYFVQTFADDGVQVKVDGKTVINRWTDYTGIVDRALLLGVSSGNHNIRTSYYENVSRSFIYSHVVPFDSWLAYYYPNDSLTGVPSAAKVIHPVGNDKKLYEDHVDSSIIEGFPSDEFSVRYATAKKIKAGEYIIRTKADDGVRVFVDGKLVLDNWSNGAYREESVKLSIANRTNVPLDEQDIHWIEVEYYDNLNVGKLEVSILPYEDAYKDTWIGELYSNNTFGGNPIIVGGVGSLSPINELNASYGDWGEGSPSTKIPVDNFSAIYKKKFTTSTTGEYLLNLQADSGARVYINGNLTIDGWVNNPDGYFKRIKLNSGTHEVKIEYVEYTGFANLQFNITKIEGPIYLSTSYDYSLSEVLNIQMNSGPQTDLHNKYVREDALYKDSKGIWRINGTGWNVRNGPGTNYDIVGTINNNTEVFLLKKIDIEGQLSWYQIAAWINPLPIDVEYYVNPKNFTIGSTEYFQFLKLSESAGLNINEVNSKILQGKGVLENKASSFIEAGQKFGINEVYLIAHALLETGNGKSDLAEGILVSSIDGQAVEPKVVYNMYGINAKDSCPLRCGSEYAYQMDWTSPEKAIVGGAEFIAKEYIHVGQDTLYKMRWNPAYPGTHQYATDIGWAVKQVKRIKNLYDLLSDYQLVFDEPNYLN